MSKTGKVKRKKKLNENYQSTKKLWCSYKRYNIHVNTKRSRKREKDKRNI
jgi:hypothetical protein